jgi:hypothetical protein
MESIRKKIELLELGEDAHRQYIDAEATFSAWEGARDAAAQVRGGMYWKVQNGTRYLIRTQPDNSQKSLGAQSPQTEQIFERFMERKKSLTERLQSLTKALERQQRMNRALRVGRAPQVLVDVLGKLAQRDLTDHFVVVGTHALYAYEALAGVRIGEPDALATRDVDLLYDTRKRVSFISTMRNSSMIGLLKEIDQSFEIRRDQPYTAVNGEGFEVDIIRRPQAESDEHPLRMTSDEDDFWATQANRADVLLNAQRFSAMIASPSGRMARMSTIAPATFVEFKRWMAAQADRDPVKKKRDRLQADIVEQLTQEYLPQWAAPELAAPESNDAPPSPRG